jgi:hypothetical protein
MNKSTIGRIQRKLLTSYCTQEFHTENGMHQISRGLCKENLSADADSEPLCLEGVVPGENQEDEAEDGKPIEKSHSPR